MSFRRRMTGHDVYPRCARCRRALDASDACRACDLADRTCPKCKAVHDHALTAARPCLFCTTRDDVDPVADTQPAPPIAAE